MLVEVIIQVASSITLFCLLSGSLWGLKLSDTPLIVSPAMSKTNSQKRSDFPDSGHDVKQRLSRTTQLYSVLF